MRRITLLISFLLALSSSVFWFIKGANLGWTKTSVQIDKYDEVLELTYPTFEDRFVPGIDFLAVALLVAIILFAVSIFIFKKPIK